MNNLTRNKIDQFLDDLIDIDNAEQLITERIGQNILDILNSEAELLSQVLKTINKEDFFKIVSSAMVTAYLLKSQVDRIELDQCLGEN